MDIIKAVETGVNQLVEGAVVIFPKLLGDQIVVNDYEGTVDQIDIRTTEIITYTGERVVIPNSAVFTSVIQVRTAFDYRRTDLSVGVD